ncbi:hypothetical protein [Ureibacillus xyleni]|uniref:hypothetical protein n=1 Tax=Ureibacillus xyleni TaxID=614648 RepID=UPI00137A479E|nr:hypothetical protein [Ureibacillus xyleni]
MKMKVEEGEGKSGIHNLMNAKSVGGLVKIVFIIAMKTKMGEGTSKNGIHTPDEDKNRWEDW